MIQRVEMSWKDQYDLFNVLQKDVLIGMLIECNRVLNKTASTIVLPEIVAGSCGFYNVGIDASGRCINCGKQQWEH